MVISMKTILFQGLRGYPTFSSGVQILIFIEIHIPIDFPGGGPDPLSPLRSRACVVSYKRSTG